VDIRAGADQRDAAPALALFSLGLPTTSPLLGPIDYYVFLRFGWILGLSVPGWRAERAGPVLQVQL
jgi:hypothetical protein